MEFQLYIHFIMNGVYQSNVATVIEGSPLGLQMSMCTEYLVE